MHLVGRVAELGSLGVMTEPAYISETTGFPVRTMPGPTRWLKPASSVVAIFAFVTYGFSGSLIPLFIAVAAGLGVVVSIACRVRCPHCRARLTPREQDEGYKRERLYYDCPECRITWKSEIVNDYDA